MNIKESIIIGAGPAGMSAAIYLRRFNRDFELISKSIGGQMFESGVVENFASFNSITGPELTKKMVSHLESLDIKIIQNEIENISYENNCFVLNCKNNKTIFSRTILMCTGSSYKKLGIPGEDEFINRGVSFCVSCDAYFFKNQIVAVIGGGNSALDAALTLSKIASSVLLVNKNDLFKGDKILYEQVLSTKNITIIKKALTKEIIGQSFVETISVEIDGVRKTFDTSGVFVKIGMTPHSSLVKNSFPIVVNNENEIITDVQNSTTVFGLFAAGDVTNVFCKQISVALGEGAKAAISVHNFLNINSFEP